MKSERHRARRYPFQANLEITDVQSEAQTRERTTDLSLFGCHVDAGKAIGTGDKSQHKDCARERDFPGPGSRSLCPIWCGNGHRIHKYSAQRPVDFGNVAG